MFTFYKNRKQKMKLVSLMGSSFPFSYFDLLKEIFSLTFMKILSGIFFLFISGLVLASVSNYFYRLSGQNVLYHYSSYIFLPIAYVYSNIKGWKWIIWSIRNPSIERTLKFFLKSNRLFTEACDGGERYISNSARIGYLDSEDSLIIIAFKDGDNFSDSMNTLESKLSALFRLPLSSKEDDIAFCKYVFEKNQDTRLNLSQGIPPVKGTVIPITQKISYDVTSVSHGLTIGGTGSGKSFLINYKILAYAQMGGLLYIIDPKSADLSLLRLIKGFKDRVATEPNQIAKMLREVSEIMEERYRTYFSDVSSFGKTFKDFNIPPVVVFFDEYAAFQKTTDKKLFSEVSAYIYSIILKGRQAGCFMEIILQRPDTSILDGAIRDQLGCRVLLGNASREAYQMCFGSSKVEHKSITVKGGGYIQIDGQGEEKYFEAPYLGKDFKFLSELEKICCKENL